MNKITHTHQLGQPHSDTLENDFQEKLNELVRDPMKFRDEYERMYRALKAS